MTYRSRIRAGLGASAIALALTATATATTPSALADSGGVGPGGGEAESGAPAGQQDPQQQVEGGRARLVGGLAVAPASAPPRVVRAIEAANRIVKGKPYCYGGGHGDWEARCYDCSGSVSYALGDPGAGVLAAPMPSGSFMRWGKPGRGRWITIYANGGHIYAVIAGLRLDTSMTAGDGPGWSKARRDQAGFSVRHPRGL